jgi:uncharacterized protein YqeY
MSIKKELMNDLKSAMKNKNKLKKSVITMLRAEIKQIEVDERTEVDDEKILDIIASQIKTKRKALEDFKTAEREDLIEETEKEIEILKEYLPEQLSDEALTAIIEETIETVGAESMKDMGAVMGKVVPQVKGKAESSKVAAIVKEKLM